MIIAECHNVIINCSNCLIATSVCLTMFNYVSIMYSSMYELMTFFYVGVCPTVNKLIVLVLVLVIVIRSQRTELVSVARCTLSVGL